MNGVLDEWTNERFLTNGRFLKKYISLSSAFAPLGYAALLCKELLGCPGKLEVVQGVKDII